MLRSTLISPSIVMLLIFRQPSAKKHNRRNHRAWETAATNAASMTTNTDISHAKRNTTQTVLSQWPGGDLAKRGLLKTKSWIYLLELLMSRKYRHERVLMLWWCPSHLVRSCTGHAFCGWEQPVKAANRAKAPVGVSPGSIKSITRACQFWAGWTCTVWHAW